MTYEFGTLRPPTPVEMQRRRVPLEILRVWWVHSYGQSMSDTPYTGCVEECDAQPFIAELAEFVKEHAIPAGAQIRHHLFGIELDWSHLTLCEVCKCWREPHGEYDELHKIMQRQADSQAARVAAVERCALCERDVVDMKAHVQRPWHLEKLAQVTA